MIKFFKYALLTALAIYAVDPPTLCAQESLPYEITFTQSNYTTWTTLDANGDGDNFGAKKWAWANSGNFCYNLTSGVTEGSDDWAISPAFELEAGRQYEITYTLCGYVSSAKNIPVDIRLMTSNSEAQPDAFLIAQYPPETGGTTNKSDLYTAIFTPTENGTYYIGFEITAAYDSSAYGKITLHKFAIQALQKASAPGALSAFSVTPGADGAESATISFTLPENDADGNPLSGDVTVNLYREDEETPFYTSEAIAPGATGSYTDTNAYPGETWYVAKAANDSGEGPASTAELWIGVDTPVAVSELSASVNAEGKPAISWVAPAQGQHEGYLDTSALTYSISRIEDGELSSLGNVSALSFVDEAIGNDTQKNISYQVTAKSSAGLGAPAESRVLNYGPQLSLPFAESFSNKAYANTPWRQEVVFNFEDANYQPQWEIIEQAVVTDGVTEDEPEGYDIVIASQDTDKGFIKFNSNAVGKMSEGAKGRLISPSIDMSEMINPVLTFWMFHETYYTTDPATNNGRRNDYVSVETAYGNSDFQTVTDATFYRYGKENNWTLCEVPLYAVAGKDRVQVALLGAGFGGGPIYIDNIRIIERTAYDLEVVALAGPKRLRAGEQGHFSLSVKNNGGTATDEYSVELLKDGEKVAEYAGVNVLPGKIAIISLIYSPETDEAGNSAAFSARIVYAKDQISDNNTSDDVTTALTAPLLPGVKQLSVSQENGAVVVKWNKADHVPAESLVEEDGFESYTPFVINEFGNFTTYDLDARPTFGIGSAAGVTYPNSGDRIAFQIFAPALTNIDPEELDMWAPHSGQQYAIAPQPIAPAESSSEASTANDWLVFPALSGNAQTIRFFARSFSDTYKEAIQGFYTTVSDPYDADDFMPCPEDGDVSYSVPTSWTELNYKVPQGARFFALRHVSGDGYALMVDDVTYQMAAPSADDAGLLGYNIYCNDEKLNDAPVTECEFRHVPMARAMNEYKVAAVYPQGEAAKSEASQIQVSTEVSEISATGITIRVNGYSVIVKGTEGTAVTLFSADGKIVDSSEGDAVLTAPGSGIYLLKIGDKIYKLMI